MLFLFCEKFMKIRLTYIIAITDDREKWCCGENKRSPGIVCWIRKLRRVGAKIRLWDSWKVSARCSTGKAKKISVKLNQFVPVKSINEHSKC